MKKLSFLLLLIGMLCFLAPNAFALTYPVATGQKVIPNDGVGPSPGGEFDIYNLGGTFLFSTFCIERNETFSPGSQYYVELADSAMKGGTNVPPGTDDPLDNVTAWLYWQFSTGALASLSYDYSGADHANDAGELQNLIWYLEEETPSSAPGTGSEGETWYNAALAAAGGMSPSWVNNGEVKVMRLWGDANFTLNHQDMLVSAVPEPATMLLLGAGLIGLASAGRKKLFKR